MSSNKVSNLNYDLDDVEDSVPTVESKKMPISTVSEEKKMLISTEENQQSVNKSSTSETEEEKILKRLTEHCKRGWIAIPKNGVLEQHETGKVSPEKFFEWVQYVFPVAKNMEYSPKYYQTQDNQENAMMNIVKYYENIRYVFKQYSTVKN